MKIPKVCIDVKIEKSFSLSEWEAWNEMDKDEREEVVRDMNSDDAIKDFAYDLGFTLDDVKHFKYHIKEN